MSFKDWLLKYEGLLEPSQVERPDIIAQSNAKKGVGAFPTYMKKKSKKRQKKG